MESTKWKCLEKNTRKETAVHINEIVKQNFDIFFYHRNDLS